MDEASMSQNRRSRRSNVLMSATIERSGVSVAVKLRNLSSEGALIEGDKLPIEGTEVLFRKAELELPGRIAWVEGKRAGVAFNRPLCPEALLRHVPTPRPRVQPDFRRPGLGPTRLTTEERMFGANFVWSKGPLPSE